MGKEISSASFSRDDYNQFTQRLRQETERLRAFFASNVFEKSPVRLGIELEGCLVDNNCNPTAKSEQVIKAINHQKVVPELAKYNFEINSPAIEIYPDCLSKLQSELTKIWQLCQVKAEKNDVAAVAIGILPTYQQHMLAYDNIYPYKRYYALEKELAKYRHGQPIMTEIYGVDDFCESFNSILLEAVTTSMQIHVQSDPADAVRMYNAAQILSAPMIAVSGNSPYLFGKNLWCDTRIPIFEQSAAVRYNFKGLPTPHERVTFGHRFAKDSLLELFEENLQDYLILLPELIDSPEEELAHLRLHNGTIWRWNRPLIGMDDPDNPNLRIEHRVNPAGPSIVDNVANIAFYLGLLTFYMQRDIPPESEIEFDHVSQNFYHAAKYGLEGNLQWLNRQSFATTDLILKTLLPQAVKGLKHLQIRQDEIDYYMDIIQQRVTSRLTGAKWQRKYIDKHGKNFNNMLSSYLENQITNKPVHLWKI